MNSLFIYTNLNASSKSEEIQKRIYEKDVKIEWKIRELKIELQPKYDKIYQEYTKEIKNKQKLTKNYQNNGIITIFNDIEKNKNKKIKELDKIKNEKIINIIKQEINDMNKDIQKIKESQSWWEFLKSLFFFSDKNSDDVN